MRAMTAAGRLGDNEYVLGTTPRSSALAPASSLATGGARGVAARGVCRGQTVIDLGCGPGFAAIDLAETVGRPAG